MIIRCFYMGHNLLHKLNRLTIKIYNHRLVWALISAQHQYSIGSRWSGRRRSDSRWSGRSSRCWNWRGNTRSSSSFHSMSSRGFNSRQCWNIRSSSSFNATEILTRTATRTVLLRIYERTFNFKIRFLPLNAYLTRAVQLLFFKFSHALIFAFFISITSIDTAAQNEAVWVQTTVPFFIAFSLLECQCYLEQNLCYISKSL